VPLLLVSISVSIAGNAAPVRAQGPPVPTPPSGSPVNFKVEKASQRLEMTVNTSRRLTLDKKIPEAQVNNPEVLEITPLSPNTIQVSAIATGVTQINLWDEDRKVYTVDVIVYADVQELDMKLKALFPHASLKVIPVGEGVLIAGYVDQPEHIDLICRVAEEYYPKVINNMTVSGVRQVLLHVKVMEVSRTKLRALGFDFSKFTGPNLVHSGISGLIGVATPETENGALVYEQAYLGGPTVKFNVFNGSSAFFGVLEALREDKLGRILAEPTIVAVSGRPAYFRVGGEIGYQLSGGITGPTTEFKQYGTRIDFVAVVLGHGRIRLEVRPLVSEIDAANSVGDIPALRTREVDTGVELQAGQTLAIAGLVQNRREAVNRGLPWISEVPYLGALFRRVQEQNNEVELLMMVTPELVEAMDAEDVPLCGPGMQTTSPSDAELYLKGHLEVPVCCPGCGGAGRSKLGVGSGGPNPATAPYEGMIIEQGEEILSPRPGNSPSAASHNRHDPSIPQSLRADFQSGTQNAEPHFLGPVGYDVVE